MFDVITIGSATRDLFIETEFLNKTIPLNSGLKFDIKKPFIQTGGGATNSAVSFSRLGLNTATIIRVGDDDPGDLIKRNLKIEKVSPKYVVTDVKHGTALSIIIWKIGSDRTLFVYRGASQYMNINDININSLKAKWFYITALRGSSIKLLMPLLNYARKNHIKTAINPGSQELKIKSLYKYVDVLLLNMQEAEILSGKKGNIKLIIKNLVKLGPKIIAVTDGKNKSFFYENGVLYSVSPYNVKIENSVGAGDAFCSGFMASFIKNNNIEKAIYYGMANASSAIQHLGAKAGLLYKNSLKTYEERLNQKLNIKKEAL